MTFPWQPGQTEQESMNAPTALASAAGAAGAGGPCGGSRSSSSSSTTAGGGGSLRARFRVERPDFRFFPALPFLFLEERFLGGLGGPSTFTNSGSLPALIGPLHLSFIRFIVSPSDSPSFFACFNRSGHDFTSLLPDMCTQLRV